MGDENGKVESEDWGRGNKFIMSENILGTVFQNYKKWVAIGSHEPLTFSLLSRPSSLWLPILTRRLQTL